MEFCEDHNVSSPVEFEFAVVEIIDFCEKRGFGKSSFGVSRNKSPEKEKLLRQVDSELHHSCFERRREK